MECKNCGSDRIYQFSFVDQDRLFNKGFGNRDELPTAQCMCCGDYFFE